MRTIIIAQRTPRWRRWLTVSLTTMMLAAVIWISNNMSLTHVFAGTPENVIVMANNEGDGGVAANVPDIAPSFLADAFDNEVYLAPGEFPESRLLGENYEYADAEIPAELANSDLTQEFYLPYGSFTEEMFYGHALEQTTPQPEAIAENTFPFNPMPAQCGIRDHGKCSAAGSVEFL